MRMHLLTDAGVDLGDTWVPDPEPTFQDDITALRFSPFSIHVKRTGVPAWVLATCDGKPWNIFEVTFGQSKIRAGDTVDIDGLYMLLTPNIDLIRRLYPDAQIETHDSSRLEGGLFNRLLGSGKKG